MAKGQQAQKMVKKPKKDSAPPKTLTSVSDRPMPPVTTILPRGKDKDKPKK